MQIEPMENADEWRCWLSPAEQELLIDHFGEEPTKQLAMRLMLHGLRSDEVRRVTKGDVRELDVDEEAFKLRVPTGKTGFRECPISTRLKTEIYALASARGDRGGRSDVPVVDVTTKTLQRWTKAAGNVLAEETEDEDWNHVRCHDLRRSWATTTYYSLADAPGRVAQDVIMQWGGWVDSDTFRNNYLGRPPDRLTADLMDAAGMV